MTTNTRKGIERSVAARLNAVSESTANTRKGIERGESPSAPKATAPLIPVRELKVVAVAGGGLATAAANTRKGIESDGNLNVIGYGSLANTRKGIESRASPGPVPGSRIEGLIPVRELKGFLNVSSPLYIYGYANTRKGIES